ncbi:hypothetical protein KY289_001818 [Solanum tuberosum]|nr:hypothetical protein KY289_001818 [Solanum tuberosum]
MEKDRDNISPRNVRVNQSQGSSGDASANAVTCAGKIFLELNTLKTPVFVDLPNSRRVKGPSMKRPLAFGKA